MFKGWHVRPRMRGGGGGGDQRTDDF
jgi:hypothetical protein